MLTALVSTAVAVSRDFGFVARRVADRVETEAGLLERRMTGMPIRRIQAVSIDEAPLRRWLGWATIDAVTAGFGHGEEKQTTTARAIVPIARRSEIPRLLHGLLPEVEEFPPVGQRSRRALRFYVTVPALASIAIALPLAIGAFLVLPLAGLGAGLTGLLVIASIVGYQVLSWRHCAFGTDACALVVASGALGRRSVRIGRSRIQSLAVRQNPFQRRAGLATVVVAGVSGSSKALYAIPHIEAADADRLMNLVLARCRARRFKRCRAGRAAPDGASGPRLVPHDPL